MNTNNVSQNAPAGDIPGSARQWAAICHASALVGLLGNVIGFLLAPLIIWLIKRAEHPFIDKQGKEALNFQITMFIILAISAILCLLLIGFAFLIIVGLLMTIFPIIAAVKSSNGEDYRYPISIRFIR